MVYLKLKVVNVVTKSLVNPFCIFCLLIQELKATNETLRALQMQLEKAFHSQSSGGPSNSTLTAILETKDARIATLEKEVSLLEHELDRLRETGARVSPLPELDKHDYSLKRQVSPQATRHSTLVYRSIF